MHTLICGVTESGKTTLARKIARDLSAAGQNIIIYDPVATGTCGGGWPEAAIIFADEDDIFEYLSREDVSGAHVFVDEAGEIFGNDKRHNLWLLTRGRHYGFHVLMIAQRPKMILPTARNQVSRTYMFRLARDDAREVGADMGHTGIEKIILDTGDFLVLLSGQASIKRANIFDLLESEK